MDFKLSRERSKKTEAVFLVGSRRSGGKSKSLRALFLLPAFSFGEAKENADAQLQICTVYQPFERLLETPEASPMRGRQRGAPHPLAPLSGADSPYQGEMSRRDKRGRDAGSAQPRLRGHRRFAIKPKPQIQFAVWKGRNGLRGKEAPRTAVRIFPVCPSADEYAVGSLLFRKIVFISQTETTS